MAKDLGPQDFVGMLHEAGANQRLASEEWVVNCYCWTVWKLAAYEQTYPQQLQGRLLTLQVVLDQLKYRWGVITGAFLSVFSLLIYVSCFA